MKQLPQGTITFLFTDIEGSTRHWERAPDAMRAALRRHDALIEERVAQAGGTVVRPRGEGDSRFAVFDRASQAVAVAAALQQAFAIEAWPTPEPLRVRIAIHSGEAELWEGDYYGPVVNRCARLRAIAHGGQVLLSEATARLVGAALPNSVTLRDLGVHHLKDLTDAEHIFQLVVPGAPSDFPPILAPDRRPTNLPLPPTPLVGRVGELREIQERLSGGEVRLLTLTGAGGIGKTRLALAAAANLLDRFQDGCFFVDLAPVHDAAFVAAAIGQTLSLRDSTDRPLEIVLRDFLRSKEVLLVLDNFEHLLSAALLIADLLEHCPKLHILVTSREALHLRWEYTYPVPPLGLPAPGSSLLPDDLTRAPAVALFLTRAQAVRPDFRLTPANAAAALAICRRLDGLPLAIELAAARIRLLPPQAIAARLEQRLDLLTGGERDLPARQRTLRGAIDWSYDLLLPAEQQLFTRLGVFTGGCSLDAVAAVCQEPIPDCRSTNSAEAETRLLEGLTSLVDKHLLYQDATESGDPRFRQLETIRAYALEQLDRRGERAAIERRHALHYLALAERAEPALLGPEQAIWFGQLDQEHDNLRAALRWLLSQRETISALRLVTALWRFWKYRGHLEEGERWVNEALTLSAVEPNELKLRAQLLYAAAEMMLHRRDHRRVAALSEESLALRRALGDKQGIAETLSQLGGLARDQGDYARGVALLEEAVALQRAMGDTWGAARSLNNLGVILRSRGDLAEAAARHHESLALFQELGDEHTAAHSLDYLAVVERDQGNDVDADRLHRESLAVFRHVGCKQGTASALYGLAFLAHRHDQPRQAAAQCAESLALAHDLGNHEDMAWSLELLADIAMAQGQFERAARLFGAADGVREGIGLVVPPIEGAAYDNRRRTATAALGEERFRWAWTAGRRMPLEQAIASARAVDRPEHSTAVNG